MLIAKVENGTVLDVADYRSMFPGVTFPDSGPTDEFMQANNCMHVNLWLPYDAMTERLDACAPYIDGEWVYTVRVVPLTPEEIEARNESEAANVRATRTRMLSDCDWTQLDDVDMDNATKNAWRTYRQELRDVTSQAGFPWTIVWPKSPNYIEPTTPTV